MSFDNNLYCYNSSTSTKLPITPGAYAFNITGTDNNVKMFPIYGNINNYSDFAFEESTDGYLVLPGYMLKTYNDYNYQSGETIYDCTYNTTVYFGLDGAENNDKSCKLFYNGNQLGNMTYTDLGPDVPPNPLPTVGNFNNFPYTITVSDSTILPLFPGAYFFNKIVYQGDNDQNKAFPLYGCITNFDYFQIGPGGSGEPVKNRYLVLPNFQLLTYNDPYISPDPPTSSIGPYVNYSGTSYMYGISGSENSDISCTLGFNDSGSTVLGLMNPATTIYPIGWSPWSDFPTNYPGSFVNGPIYYTTLANNIFPPTPFAWMFVQGSGDQTKALPIYGSIHTYGYFEIGDTVDAYLVLPGFCLITFDDFDWGGGRRIYNNILGSDYFYVNLPEEQQFQNDSSCLLFYKGVDNTTNLLGLMY
jgi:hypothetical protein